jgi:hypothetical protein
MDAEIKDIYRQLAMHVPMATGKLSGASITVPTNTLQLTQQIITLHFYIFRWM